MQSRYIFEQQLLDLWLTLSMHLPGSSATGFLNALGDIGEKYGRKHHISHTLFTRAAAEYSYLQDELLLVKHQDNMKCPPCSVEQHMCHIDGNHKVYRFNYVNRGVAKPYHIDRFIADDSSVDEHVKSVYRFHPTKVSFCYE
ncbi:uncharacterized protein [Amphiura filiformis]|uniref:uncharacterized protein n=1 Tax=Amphiura filiformis TaxID=82378 RepID=UPI003B21D1C4